MLYLTDGSAKEENKDGVWWKGAFYDNDGNEVIAETEDELDAKLKILDKENSKRLEEEIKMEDARMKELEPKIKKVKLESIIMDDEVRLRDINCHRTREMSCAMRRYGEDKWQKNWNGIPIMTESNHLWSGFHTITAAKSAFGKDHEIEVAVEGKTKRDAYLLITGTNATHGFNREEDDEITAVKKWLQHPELQLWTNAHIARKCNVDEDFVYGINDELMKFEIGYTRPTKLKYIDYLRREMWIETDKRKVEAEKKAKKAEEKARRPQHQYTLEF